MRILVSFASDPEQEKNTWFKWPGASSAMRDGDALRLEAAIKADIVQGIDMVRADIARSQS